MNIPFVRTFKKPYPTIACDNCKEVRPLTLIAAGSSRLRLCSECLAELKRQLLIAQAEAKV